MADVHGQPSFAGAFGVHDGGQQHMTELNLQAATKKTRAERDNGLRKTRTEATEDDKGWNKKGTRLKYEGY